MSGGMTREQRLALLAGALRVARERGMRDWALGIAEAVEGWLMAQSYGDQEVDCASRFLRIAIDLKHEAHDA